MSPISDAVRTVREVGLEHSAQESLALVERRAGATSVDRERVRGSHQGAAHVRRAQLHATDRLPELQEAAARALQAGTAVQRYGVVIVVVVIIIIISDVIRRCTSSCVWCVCVCVMCAL